MTGHDVEPSLAGTYFDGRSAQGWPVTLRCAAGQLTVTGASFSFSLPLAQVRLSPRLGRTKRQLSFPDGPVCEVVDDPLLDRWFTADTVRRGNRLAYLEGHWGVIAASFILIGALTVGLAVWGLPWAAKQVARTLPLEWVDQLGAGTLTAMDQALGRETALPAARREQLTREFAILARTAGVGARFEYRTWARLGANALALPDGTIVVTDGLVKLAQDDRELLAVIGHELGHVHERHALQKVLASSGVAALVFVLTGDLSGLSGVAVTAPTVLTHLKHSRDLEADADRFAFALLARADIEPSWFARIMRRLEQEAGPDDGSEWLQSHPMTEQRARAAEQFRAAR